MIHRSYHYFDMYNLNDTDKIYFDDRMIWLMDCDYYKRLYLKYGAPTILNKITVVNRDHADQLTHVMDPKIKKDEYQMMLEKYE